jgi:lipopolysaccharide biosynthesis protein
VNSLCLFAANLREDHLPPYVKVYLTELSHHFEKVELICNRRDLDDEDVAWLDQSNIRLCMHKNEGYDFGLWSKELENHEIEAHGRIALVNDSNVLLKSLEPFMEWSEDRSETLIGMLDSKEVAHHIQSYFWVLNATGVNLFKNYMREHGILKKMKDVIHTYEIGFCQFLQAHNEQFTSFFDHSKYIDGDRTNPSYHFIHELIADGFPMIKKQIVTGDYRSKDQQYLEDKGFNTNAETHLQRLKELEGRIIEYEDLPKPHAKSWYDKINPFW